MSQITYGPPIGEVDRQAVAAEVYTYWRRRMIRTGAGSGVSDACSTAWKPAEGDPSAYSDYEEHRILMDASAADLRALYAMLIARGIVPQLWEVD